MRKYFILVTQHDGQTAALIVREINNPRPGAKPYEYDFAKHDRQSGTRFEEPAIARLTIIDAKEWIDNRHPPCVGKYTLSVEPCEEVNGVLVTARSRKAPDPETSEARAERIIGKRL